MPALAPVVGCAEVQFFHTLAGRLWSCRMFWQDGHGLEYTDSDINTLANTAGTAWGANVVAALSHDVEFVQVIATDLSSTTAPRVELTVSTAGGNSNPAEPLNVAAVVQFHAIERYRGGKSHIYVAGVATGFRTNEGYWTGGFDSGLLTAIENVQTAVAAVTTSHGSVWDQVIVSRFRGHAERIPPVTLQIPDTSIQPRICTRRKRLPKITA